MKKILITIFCMWMLMDLIDFIAVKTHSDKKQNKVACERIIETAHEHPIGMFLLASGWVVACVEELK